MDLKAILTEVQSWPASDRLRLIEEVWHGLSDEGVDPGLTEDLRDLLDRRLAALAADPGDVATLGEIKTYVRRRDEPPAGPPGGRAGRNRWSDARYEGRRPGMGEEFLAEVQRVLDRIEQNPEIHAPIYQAVRHGRLKRFPYAVSYRIEPERTVIIAVHHGKRDPGSWRSRA